MTGTHDSGTGTTTTTATASTTATTETRGRRQTWRIACLIAVHVYIVFHLVAWYVFDWQIWGKTAMVGVLSMLAGRVNAAAIMIVIMLLSVLLWGRFFCGWLCHMRGAIELADWLMRKMGLKSYTKLRKRNVLLNTRYRFLFRIVTLVVLLLPILPLWASGGIQFDPNPETLPPMADLPGHEGHLLAESAPTNVEMDFTVGHVLLGLGTILFIQFVMSFVLNYFYGQGAFCRVLCPYGLIFMPFMNKVPWQKKITRVSQCTGCRKCSKACPQGVDVAREIWHNRGKVTSLECIKCYHCVDACGHNALADSRGAAEPQQKPRTEYERQPWLNKHKSTQVTEPMHPLLDVASVIMAVIWGTIASVLGGFWFYVGAIVGFIAFRSLFVQRPAEKDATPALEDLKKAA